MRIGLVLPKMPAYSETFFRQKINGLQAKGFRVILFVGGRAGENPDGWEVAEAPVLSGTNPLSLGRRIIGVALRAWGRTPRKAWKLFQLERNYGQSVHGAFRSVLINQHILAYDLDWLHFGFATMGLGRELVAEAIGAKMAVSLRGFDITVYPLKHPGCYARLWSRVDAIHAISEGIREMAMVQGLPAEKPWLKITPALELGQPGQLAADATGPVLQIITVARLHWVKGLEYALAAMRMIKEAGVSFRYTVIGEGPDRERLEFARQQLGLQKEVLLPGALPHAEVFRHLQQNDIYLQPSLMEGFCNAVLEAQWSGLLCIVSDVGGLRENILHGQTGWRIPPRSPLAIANKVMETAQLEGEQRQQIIRQARERVRSEFAVEKQMDAFTRFYKELI